MKRFTIPEEMLEAAQRAKDSQAHVSIWRKTPNTITESIFVKNVQGNDITFYGPHVGTFVTNVNNMNYFEVNG